MLNYHIHIYHKPNIHTEKKTLQNFTNMFTCNNLPPPSIEPPPSPPDPMFIPLPKLPFPTPPPEIGIHVLLNKKRP